MKSKSTEPQLVLFTYNRPIHTSKVLEALRKEEIERITIYMDAPISEKDVQLQSQLADVFRSNHWLKIKLIKRRTNLGLAKSITSAITEQLDENRSVIVLEDDCCPRPGFFRFMKKALQQYVDKPEIRSVCGYQYPFVSLKKLEIHDVGLCRFNPWGWATWTDRWKDFNLDLKKILSKVNKKLLLQKLSQDLRNYCEEKIFLEQKADIWSINWVLIHYITDTFSIFPSRTLIENIGFDGTGVHSINTNEFAADNFFQNTDMYSINLCEEPTVNHKIGESIDQFLEVHSYKTMIKNSHLEHFQIV